MNICLTGCPLWQNLCDWRVSSDGETRTVPPYDYFSGPIDAPDYIPAGGMQNTVIFNGLLHRCQGRDIVLQRG